MSDYADLIERLRARITTTGPYGQTHNGLDLEAADALETLQAEVEYLRETRALLMDAEAIRSDLKRTMHEMQQQIADLIAERDALRKRLGEEV